MAYLARRTFPGLSQFARLFFCNIGPLRVISFAVDGSYPSYFVEVSFATIQLLTVRISLCVGFLRCVELAVLAVL